MRPIPCALPAAFLVLALAASAAAGAGTPVHDELPDDRVLYIAPGQSLSRLVERVYPQRPGDWDAIRAWIVEHNPHAFIGGDPDRLRAGVRVQLPTPSAIATQDRAGAYSLREGAPAASPQPTLAFDRRFVFVDPSQSLSELVPKLYPRQKARWDAIIEAIIERNAERLAGTDAGAVIERGTRLRIPELRWRAPAPATTPDAEPDRPDPGPAVAAVVRAEGEVKATDAAGRTRELEAGDAIRRHDTLTTGEQGRARIRFDDGERLFLRPGSRVRVRDWALPETGPGRRVVELLRGGLRAVTGAIGNRSGDTYRTITPQTTLGVRGTEYALRVCGEGECRRAGSGNGALDPGLYIGVGAGRVRLLNETGETGVAAGEYRYVAGPGSTPAPAGPAAARVVYTEAELRAGIGPPPGEAAPKADQDGGASWGWALLGLVLLGAGL